MSKISLITFPLGGPRVWAEQLKTELEKRGHTVTLFAGRKDYLKAIFQRHEIVHTCVPLPFLWCRKYILTIHGNYKKEKWIGRIMTPLAVMRADAVTVPSQFLKNILGISKALVIPNGIHLPEKTKTDYTLLHENPTLGIMTNFHFRPKAEGVVALAKIIHRIDPSIRLLVAGTGSFFDEFKPNIVSAHPNTEFLGYCDPADFFSQIDMFTYYSLLDNQPIAMLQAMAFGLPVISNPVGATGEILTDDLQAYLTNDDGQYQSVLLSLIQSASQRKQAGTLTQKKAQGYSWDKIINQFIILY